MTHVNKVEFRTVIIDEIKRELNILSYTKENFSIYFSLQSIAQFINELLEVFSAKDIFYDDFYEKWKTIGLKCFTEFQVQLLVPINLIIEPSTELYNPLPAIIQNTQYLNDKYYKKINEYTNIKNFITSDVFCIAEKNKLTVTDFRHKFMNSIGFLSFIPILRLRYLRIFYKTFFNVKLLNCTDIEYIYDTLILNRQRLDEIDIENVFQLDKNGLHFEEMDINQDIKDLFLFNFNRACRIFKSFAFNIMDEQSLYISKNLQIVTQFGLDRENIEKTFKDIVKTLELEREKKRKELEKGGTTTKEKRPKYNREQMNLLCKEPEPSSPILNLNVIELNILHSIIKIHLMIQRMTNVQIHKDDLQYYRKLLKTRYSTDLEELILDNDDLLNGCNRNAGGDDYDDEISRSTISFETICGKQCLVKNYTIGEIIGEFIRLYQYAQQNIDTIWLCKFITMSCNPRYSSLVNIMADFVPFFQRFFTNDFNINTINNLIIFLQGMCRPDDVKIKSLKNVYDVRNLNVHNFKTFSIAKYQSYNTNPLVSFIDLVLTSKRIQRYNNNNQDNSTIINMNRLSEIEQYNLVSLIDPNEQDFIDYIYELMKTEEENENNENRSNNIDLSGEKRFHLQDIDYDSIVPLVSTNTFNENNTTNESIKLFNGILNQTIFFHELTNRVIYKIPNIVCNILIK